MSQLKYLDLSHNKIKDITDLAEISSRTIVTMNFSYNQIDYIPPEISQFYFALMYLYLSDNQLTYIPTDVFKLQYLYEADFQRNLLPVDEIAAIKGKFRSSVPRCTLTV
jgi:Leucine-rich repeat (LRR) protein